MVLNSNRILCIEFINQLCKTYNLMQRKVTFTVEKRFFYTETQTSKGVWYIIPYLKSPREYFYFLTIL